jgi:hypothetical protein
MGEDDNDDRQALWDERWRLVCRLRLSALYHLKRERFFDNADRCIKAFAVIGGAAAVSQLIADATAKLWIAALVSVLSTVSLVFALSQKARRHSELARDFTKLLARVEEAGPYPSPDKLDKFCSEITNLEASEPAAMSALVRHCENQISMSTGHPEEVIPLTPWQLLWMHLWDFALEVKTPPKPPAPLAAPPASTLPPP